MFKIPDNSKRFTQTNASDLKGNIWYTKNINFDLEGYIQLSSRAVALQSEADDADFDIPLSYGRTAPGNFLVVTADAPWIMQADPSLGVTVTQDADTGVPTGGTLGQFDAWGRWWQNRWYMSTLTGLYYKSGSTWTNASVSLTTGKVHPLEVFANRQTMCIGNGNEVAQINTSHATTSLSQLVLPSDYEVVSLSYSSNRLAVATKLSDSATEQNQEAMLFIWDGTTTSANGGYPVGSDQILSIIPYKSSWVIITRLGRQLYFNGGGFDEIAVFPYYSTGLSLGESQNRSTNGDTMLADGGVFYSNISSDLNVFGTREESYIENQPSGVWCYDETVGLYHRYAPSISKFTSSAVTNTNVDISTNILTATSPVVPPTGSPCVQLYNSADKIGGLTPSTIYYVIRVTTSQFKLATTYQNAIDAQPIDITAQAAGTSYFAFLDQVDFGATWSSGRAGGMGMVSKATNISDHVLFGGEYKDVTDTLYAYGCMTVPQFENRGYFVTTKMTSQEVEDTALKGFIKYRPLYTGDSIILKYKNRDELGIPVTSGQASESLNCSWTSTTTFTTSSNFAAAKTFIDAGGELECEVINGAGAGCIEQITSIDVSGSTYTVTLSNAIMGVSVGNKCNVIINNWRTLLTISGENADGYKEFSIGSPSKWIMIKCEMRGVGVTVEELQVVNKTHKPSK